MATNGKKVSLGLLTLFFLILQVVYIQFVLSDLYITDRWDAYPKLLQEARSKVVPVVVLFYMVSVLAYVSLLRL